MPHCLPKFRSASDNCVCSWTKMQSNFQNLYILQICSSYICAITQTLFLYWFRQLLSLKMRISCTCHRLEAGGWKCKINFIKSQQENQAAEKLSSRDHEFESRQCHHLLFLRAKRAKVAVLSDWEGYRALSLSSVRHSDTSLSWESVGSCAWKRVHNNFLWRCIRR